MVLKVLNSNKIGGIILSPIVAILLYAYGYYSQVKPMALFDDDGMPLWNWVSTFLVNHPEWYLPSGFIVAIFIAIFINRMVNKYLLFGKPTFLPANLFLILSSGFIINQSINPVWIFAFFFIWSLDNFFAASIKENQAESCFLGALLYAFGTLFYGKALFLAPIVWFMMIGLRAFSLKTFLASILGLSLPYLYIFFVPISLSEQRDLFDLIVYNMFVPVRMLPFSIPFFIYIGFLSLILILGLVNVIGKYSSKKIATRNYFKILIISVLFLFGLTFTRLFSIEIIPLLAIGSSILLSHLINNLRSPKVSGLIFYLLLILTFWAQYFFS